MKKPSLILLLITLAGCGGSTDSGSAFAPSAGASTRAESIVAQQTTAAVDSAQFLTEAYQGGLAEIQLSRLAVDKATDNNVRKFAQAMVDQHTVVNRQISQLAHRNGITLPDAPTQEQTAGINRLSALSGEEFDRAYLQANVDQHEKDVVAAMQQAGQGTDANVRSFAQGSVPLLKLHLAAAEDIHAVLRPEAYLDLAYRSGLAEIQSSQLALQKASTQDVRDFAQKMVSDHTVANQKIEALAAQKGFQLSRQVSPVDQAAAADLERFTGTDFDKMYMDMNAVMHAKALRLTQEQARNGKDADVKGLADQSVISLAEHLASAVRIDKAIEPSLLFKAAQGGVAEVQFAQLALLKSENAQVRAYAQRMIDEHTRQNAQIAQLAQQRNVALPMELAPEHLLAYIRLVLLSESKFDRTYIKDNVSYHRQVIENFTRRAQQEQDAELRQLAQSVLPVLNEHLTQAQEISQQLGSGSQAAPSHTTR